MDERLSEYLKNAKYLPDFMRDFHDQKTLFKRLNEIVQKGNNKYVEDINWASAHVYTVDIFLWFMACHGYTLQKSRKQVEFYDIYHDLSEFEKRLNEEHANFLKQIIEENMRKKPVDPE